MVGVRELRRAVAAFGKRFYDLDVDWQSKTLIPTGADEGLEACFSGLSNRPTRWCLSNRFMTAFC